MSALSSPTFQQVADRPPTRERGAHLGTERLTSNLQGIDNVFGLVGGRVSPTATSTKATRRSGRCTIDLADIPLLQRFPFRLRRECDRCLSAPWARPGL